MKIPKHILELAKKMCLKSDSQFKMSAVLFDSRGRVISVGFNRSLKKYGSSGKVIRGIGFSHSIHCERDCLRYCKEEEIVGKYMFVYRKGGNLAKPCPSCMKKIDKYRIKVYWSEK